ncbi:hypothetical protein LCGC14_2011330 [marine sediment metagenome]|uniref:Uncharacterized protein n=1 Tax=marine sediment metagenome TaxID=412755 RepID=A0A0F9HDN8_9ZZZZ
MTDNETVSVKVVRRNHRFEVLVNGEYITVEDYPGDAHGIATRLRRALGIVMEPEGKCW